MMLQMHGLGRADMCESHGKDTYVLWHERSILGNISKWQRQVMYMWRAVHISVCHCDMVLQLQKLWHQQRRAYIF